MYVIVTTSKKIAEYAKKNGASVAEFDGFTSVSRKARKKAAGKEKCVIELLRNLGIKPNYKGYGYFKYIFERCISTPGYHNLPLTTVIYTECAEKFNDSPINVNRTLRHVLSIGYNESPEVYETIFKVKLSKVPTMSEFIAMAGEYLLENSI